MGIVQFFTGNWLGGIWMGLIGMFLNSAAQEQLPAGRWCGRRSQGEPVRRFMNPDPIVVPPSLDLRHWVEDYVYRYHRKAFPVVSDGHLEGSSDPGADRDPARRVGPAHRRRGDATQPGAITISPDADAAGCHGQDAAKRRDVPHGHSRRATREHDQLTRTSSGSWI